MRARARAQFIFRWEWYFPWIFGWWFLFFFYFFLFIPEISRPFFVVVVVVVVAASTGCCFHFMYFIICMHFGLIAVGCWIVQMLRFLFLAMYMYVCIGYYIHIFTIFPNIITDRVYRYHINIFLFRVTCTIDWNCLWFCTGKSLNCVSTNPDPKLLQFNIQSVESIFEIWNANFERNEAAHRPTIQIHSSGRKKAMQKKMKFFFPEKLFNPESNKQTATTT